MGQGKVQFVSLCVCEGERKWKMSRGMRFSVCWMQLWGGTRGMELITAGKDKGKNNSNEEEESCLVERELVVESAVDEKGCLWLKGRSEEMQRKKRFVC